MSALEIPLTHGFVAVVDAADYDDLMQFKWYATPKRGPYARRSLRRNGRQVYEWMHRRVMPGVPLIDHINGDGLDNRRSNLRQATPSQNNMNKSRLQGNNKSGFRGVHKHSQMDRWTSQIRVNGRARHLGLFLTPEEAARAWDAAAVECYGEFAGYLNFPDEVRQ